MAYVKISDPAVIDLAAWHQLITVINQHSDTIAALSNNFGMAWSPVYTDDDTNWASPFDFGSSMIQFGRAKIVKDSANVTNGVYYEDVLFTNSFSSNPVVVATPYQTGTNVESNTDTVVTTFNLTTEGFTYRFSDSTGHSFNTQTYINWVAIGPK
jgi:hypothetical protein